MAEEKVVTLHRLLSDVPGYQYSDDELDAIEEVDPAMALRLARVQHQAAQQQRDMPSDAPVVEEDVRRAIDEARRILAQDGGDLELVEIQDRIVKVRLKGACVGCPNAVLDLRNVVERLIKTHAPGVHEVQNIF